MSSSLKRGQEPWSFWGKGLIRAAYLHNRRPSSYLKGLSPIQFRAGKPVDYSRLRVFGCPAEIHIRASRRENGKLDDRSERGVLVGMSAKGNGWIFYVPRTRETATIVDSADAKFNELFYDVKERKNVTTPKGQVLEAPLHASRGKNLNHPRCSKTASSDLTLARL